MSLDERFVLLAAAFAIGCIVGYVTRMLTEIKKELEELPHQKDESGYGRVQAVNHFLLGCIVVLTAFAAFKSQNAVNQIRENSRNSVISICRGGTDSRNAQRDLVEAVYKLATGVVQRNPNRPMTAEEITRINSYIRNATDFRDGMYKKIQPSDACRRYVTDVNVKPPTEPFPLLPIPKE